jgi:hypothetical protein
LGLNPRHHAAGWLLAALGLLYPAPLFAQSVPAYQMGTALPNDLAKFQRNGQIRDAVGIAGDNNGMGVNPFAATDYGQLGICSNSAATTGPYYQVCIGHNTAGDGLLTVDNLGGAPPKAFKLIVNGAEIPIAGAPPAAAACANILVYGGDPAGVADNDAAFAAAVANPSVNGPCVYFPAGTYKFAAQAVINITLAQKTARIVGDGKDLSKLTWTGGGGIQINSNQRQSRVAVDGLTLLTGSSNAGVGIDIEFSVHNNTFGSSIFRELRIAGIVNQTNYWGAAIKINGLSQVNYDGLDLYGQNSGLGIGLGGGLCLDLEGSSSNNSFIHNVVNSNFFGCDAGILYGQYVQGLTVVNSNFVNNINGIRVVASSGAATQSQLSVTNSQLDNNGDNILLAGGNNALISNNFFAILPNTTAMRVTGGQFFQFSNNQIASTPPGLQTAVGIQVDVPGATNIPNRIDGTVCVQITTCIALGAGTKFWKVTNTLFDYLPGTTPVTNAGTFNELTGGLQTGAFNFPQQYGITAAANNGSGLVRATLVPAMTPDKLLINDEVVYALIPGVLSAGGLFKITVVNSSTVDLQGSTFTGTLTSGGIVSVLP